MNELGKRIKIIPISDALSSLVSKYAQREIDFSSLKSSVEAIIDSLSVDEQVFFFINLDQLLEGMSLSVEDDEDASTLFPFIMETVRNKGGELVNVSEFEFSQNR